MATPTANYGFIKDAPTQLYDVAVVNANLDAIDAIIRDHETKFETAGDDVRADYDESFPNHPGVASGTGLGIPRCRLVQTASQTVVRNTPETLELGSASVAYDTDGMALKTSDGIKIKRAGLYICTLRVAWELNSSGDRMAIIRKNNAATGYLADDYRKSVTDTITVTTISTPPVALAVNDLITGYISHTAGSAGTNLQTVDGSAYAGSYLDVCWYAS